MRLQDFASALIVKPSSLGDIVHTLPAVAALKAAHPTLHVRWIAKPEWLPLVSGAACVDEVIPFPQKKLKGIRALMRWRAEFRALRPAEPELVLDFQGLLRSAFISRARGSRPVWGLSDAREGASWFYDKTVPVDAAAHAVDRYLTLSKALGADQAPVQFDLPTGHPPSMPLPEDFIVLHPYSRGEGKSLSPDSIRALCAALAPAHVLLVGVSDAPVKIESPHVIDLVGRTSLAELIWIMRHARKVISVDSGPMHIAAAVNNATLGIHTWSDPRKVGPYNPQASVWKADRIAHRAHLSPAQCQDSSVVTPAAVQAMAEWAVGSDGMT
jgi:heptosyltransferase I